MENEHIVLKRLRSHLYAPAALGFPVREEAITPVAAGNFDVRGDVVAVGSVGLLRVCIGVKSLGITVLNPNYIGFVLPVCIESEYLINGASANVHDIYTSGDSDSVHVHGGKRELLGATLPREKFAQTLAALNGTDVDGVSLNAPVLNLSREMGMKIRLRLRYLMEWLMERNDPYSRMAGVDQTYGLLLDAVMSASVEPHGASGKINRPDRIVRMAEDHFMASTNKTVSLADLCAAAGVGKSTLYLAFHRVCGMPPLEYFHKRRLSRARDQLIKTLPGRGQVKRAALDNGFTELGRFSVEYRRLFGELPSVTLSEFHPLP